MGEDRGLKNWVGKRVGIALQSGSSKAVLKSIDAQGIIVAGASGGDCFYPLHSIRKITLLESTTEQQPSAQERPNPGDLTAGIVRDNL